MTTRTKHIILGTMIVLIALLIVVASPAQQKPDLAIPPPAIQSEVAQASKAEADALKAYQAAIGTTRAALFKAMAQSSILPSDCATAENEFACIRAVKEGIAFERKKPDAKASPTPTVKP